MRPWGPEHLPHTVVAIFFLVVFLFLPCLVLILYPLCNIRRHLSGRICSARYVQYFSACMEVFYGYFKDGTGGTRDYRFFGGMQFIFKFLLFFCVLFGPTKINEQPNYFLFQIGAMLWALLIIVVQPYKNENHAKFQAAVLLYLSMAISVGIYTFISVNRAAQLIFFLLWFSPPLAAIVISGLVLLIPKLQQCSFCAPRKASVPMEIITNDCSYELSEVSTEDRLATYVYTSVPTVQEDYN